MSLKAQYGAMNGATTIEQSRYAEECEMQQRADEPPVPMVFDEDTGMGRPADAVPSLEEKPVEWPDPQPLPSCIPPVEPFDVHLLPHSFAGWLQDISERTQAPIDYSAAAAMVALSTVVGRRIAIRPKRQDDWTVIPNLWGMAIGRPGVMKSQAIQEAFRPLTRLEIKAGERFDDAMKEFRAQEIIAEAQQAAAKKAVAKAVTAGDPTHAQEMAAKAVESEITQPVRRRYLLSDATVEKLGEIIANNPLGVGVLRDELLGMLRTLDKEEWAAARAFYLQAWNGTGRYVFDRINRGTLVVENACVSLFGGIQPGPLGDYLRAAVRGGSADDGMLQRFQLAVYPDVSTEWQNIDRWPDSDAKLTAYSVFEMMDSLQPAEIGAKTDDDDPDGVPYLRFSPEAQEAFDAWRAETEPRLRSDDEHPAIISHLGKYRSLIPSIALLIHLAAWEDFEAVGLKSIETAIKWAKYLESHTRRIFAVVIGDDTAGAKTLIDKIKAGSLKTGFGVRDVYRNRWVGLTTKEDTEEAIDILLDLGWVRERKEATSGRPKLVYDVNPKIERKE